MSRIYYWDKESHTFKEGYPPPKFDTYGQAPSIIQDTLKAPYYHQGACMWTDSRKGIEDMDKATGCVTDTIKHKPNKAFREENDRKRREDIVEARKKAIAQIDAGTAPLTEETRAMCERQNEIVSNALNFDAFNVAGRKKNGKGKRFRRK